MTDILVVEDNVEMGSLLCDFLQSEGYSVTHCLNGEDAVEKLKSLGASIIEIEENITDISSTKIREDLLYKNEGVLLDNRIKDYIISNNLYGV